VESGEWRVETGERESMKKWREERDSLLRESGEREAIKGKRLMVCSMEQLR